MRLHSKSIFKWVMTLSFIMAVGILFLFLFNFRASFISIVAMPLSILAGIMVIKAFGLGINSMTLGGIAVAIGMVVDDAIVDVENVYRRLRINRSLPNPEPVLNVVFKGSSEIRTSIVYATIIIIIAFIPIFLLSGLEGRIFRPLGIAFIASMLSSLLVAVTLTPVLCHLLLTRKEEKEHENELAQAGVPLLQFETKIGNAGAALDTTPSSTAGGNDDSSPGLEKEGALVRFLKKSYERVLNQSLKRFYLVVTVSAFLFVTALAMLPFLGRSFINCRSIYMSVPHLKTMMIVERPTEDEERTVLTPGVPFTALSIGKVIRASTSSGESPGASPSFHY